MLVLSRKLGEEITIGDEVTVKVIAIQGDKVRLGIEAPRCIPVHRREVFDAIRRNGEGRVGPGAPRRTAAIARR